MKQLFKGPFNWGDQLCVLARPDRNVFPETIWQTGVLRIGEDLQWLLDNTLNKLC